VKCSPRIILNSIVRVTVKSTETRHRRSTKLKEVAIDIIIGKRTMLKSSSGGQ
jgi:hypothetical protein